MSEETQKVSPEIFALRVAAADAIFAYIEETPMEFFKFAYPDNAVPLSMILGCKALDAIHPILQAKITELEAQIARVRELHGCDKNECSDECRHICKECGEPDPCCTISALEGK